MAEDEEDWIRLICVDVDEVESPVSLSWGFQQDVLDDLSLMLSDKEWCSQARVFDVLKRFRRESNKEVVDCLIHGAIWMLDHNLVDDRMKTCAEKPVSPGTLDFNAEMHGSRHNLTNAGVSLIVATKANWWTEGHHVGEKGLSNLLRQHLKELFKDKARFYIHNRLVYEALWVAGHWLNSNWTLANLINKVHPCPFPAISTLTLNALDRFPCGAGKFSLYFQVLSSMSQGRYNPALNLIDKQVLTKFLSTYLSIKHNPAAYHQKATRADWPSPIQVKQLHESIRTLCSAYIHAVCPNSRLTKASGITREQYIFQTEAYRVIKICHILPSTMNNSIY